MADDASIEDSPQRIDIGPAIGIATPGALFGRHIGRRPDRAPSIGQLRCVQRAGNSKVGKQRNHEVVKRFQLHGIRLARASRTQQNIARFDIAMDKPVQMGKG